MAKIGKRNLMIVIALLVILNISSNSNLSTDELEEYTVQLVKNQAGDQSTLLYEGFFGSKFNEVEVMDVDKSGNKYISGRYVSHYTYVDQVYTLDEIDIHLTKFDVDGHTVLFENVFGGSEIEEPQAMLIDDLGYIYIAGYTDSVDFPCSPDAYQTIKSEDKDAFIMKLDNSGDLLHSTYLGGGALDNISDMKFDTECNLVLLGYTYSLDFPTTTDAFNSTPNGSMDIFITVMDPNLTTIYYSTYFGGSDYETAAGIEVVGNNTIIMASYTYSEDFPATSNAFNNQITGGSDMMVTKINISTNDLIFSTFIGGTLNDYCIDFGIDNLGNIILTGYTLSNDYPMITGGFDNSFNGNYDLFLTKLSSNGEVILNSTYIGGDDQDIVCDMTIDSTGSVFLVGYTKSANFPTTPNKYYSTTWTYNGFLTKISNNGQNVTYSSKTLVSSIRTCYIDSSGSFFAYGSSTYYSYFVNIFCETVDNDNDSIWDWLEINLYGTLTSTNDTDSDDISDSDEIFNYYTNPCNPDSDNDGILDWSEIFIYFSNANDNDTDSDGMPDGWEVQYGFNPTNTTDATADADADGFSNLQEFNAETDPLDPNDPPSEKPTDDEPTDDEPTDDEPTDDEPTDDEPTDDEPTDEGRVNPGIPGYSLVVILGGCISLITVYTLQISRKKKTQ